MSVETLIRPETKDFGWSAIKIAQGNQERAFHKLSPVGIVSHAYMSEAGKGLREVTSEIVDKYGGLPVPEDITKALSRQQSAKAWTNFHGLSLGAAALATEDMMINGVFDPNFVVEIVNPHLIGTFLKPWKVGFQKPQALHPEQRRILFKLAEKDSTLSTILDTDIPEPSPLPRYVRDLLVASRNFVNTRYILKSFKSWVEEFKEELKRETAVSTQT